MKKRPKVAVGAAPREQTFTAGCGRTWPLTSDAADLAFTALEFPECPVCTHRVEPEGAPAFCTLRPQGTAHPFAALSRLEWPD